MIPLMSFDGYLLLKDAPRLHELHINYLRSIGITIIDPVGRDIDRKLVKDSCVSAHGKNYTIHYSIVNK